MSENKLTLTSTLLVLSSVIMWATSFPLIKVGLDYAPPVTFSAVRYLIAALFMTLVLTYRKGLAEMMKEYLEDWKTLTLLGLVGIALPNALLNIGLQFTTASLSSIIQASGPVWTVIVAVPLLKESLGVDKIAGMVIAMAATVLLVTEGGIDINNSTFLGNVLILGTAICYAFSGVITKVALRKHHPIETTGWSLITGSLILLALAPIDWGEGVALNSDFLIILVFLGLFPGALAFLLYNYVLVKSEVSTLSLFLYLIPVFATIISIVFLGENITLMTVILGSMIIFGVAVAQYRLITRWRQSGNESG